MVELVRQNANVIVVRTFSKIFGLAGLRWATRCKPDLIAELRRWQTTFCAVNRLGIVAARAAYTDGAHHAFHQRLPARQILSRAGATGHKAILIRGQISSRSRPRVVHRNSSRACRAITTSACGRLNSRKNWVRLSMGTTEEMESVTSRSRKSAKDRQFCNPTDQLQPAVASSSTSSPALFDLFAWHASSA
jgi:histidinol-phosphate/aromatic aminotransferase/cobyric acid decarboxylase-like protein